jgi:acetyl esterase/lipase
MPTAAAPAGAGRRTESGAPVSTGKPAALGTLPPHVAQMFDAIGPHWGSDINKHRDLVIEHYTPLVQAQPNAGVSVARDMAYGTDERQVLDVYTPVDAQASPRDVVIFFHGGAFIRGKKSFNGHIYDNVAYWLAGQGIVAVNAEYRLAPQTSYPGGALDVVQAFRWVSQNIGKMGGRADRIFLMGHSAGGTHIASALFDPAIDRLQSSEVAGAILVSARLCADVLPDNPNAGGVRAYFGDDAALYEKRSPTTHAQSSNVPVLVAVAQHENPHLDRYGEEFYRRASAPPRTALTRFVSLERHNHTSIVAHFNSGEDTLGEHILRFMADV